MDICVGTDNPSNPALGQSAPRSSLTSLAETAMPSRDAPLPQAEEGIVRIKKLAGMIECDHPAAAASLREGLEETFTINRADVPPSLHRCLATTNLIESPQSGVRKKTGNVCRWRDGEMTLRWVAGAFLLTEKNFRKIMGYHDLWALASILGRSPNAASSHKEKVA